MTLECTVLSYFETCPSGEFVIGRQWCVSAFLKNEKGNRDGRLEFGVECKGAAIEKA
jgi:hypothetical protein